MLQYYDEARDRRRHMVFYGAGSILCVLFVVGGWWPARPVDWPWNWNSYLHGPLTVNQFLAAVEKNDLPTAYGIWMHDKNWQQHPAQSGPYTVRALPGGLELAPAPTTNTA